MSKTYSYDEIKYLNDDMKFACSINMLLFAKEEKEENDSSILLINNLLNNTSNNVIILKLRDIKLIVGENVSRNFEYWSLDNNEDYIDKLIIESYKEVINDDNLFGFLEHNMFLQALNYISIKDDSYEKEAGLNITKYKFKLYNELFLKSCNEFYNPNENTNYFSYNDVKYLNDNQMVGVNYGFILRIFNSSTDINLKLMLRKYISKGEKNLHKNVNIMLKELKEIGKDNDITSMNFLLTMDRNEYNEKALQEIFNKLNNGEFENYIILGNLNKAKLYAFNNFDTESKNLAMKAIKIKTPKHPVQAYNRNNKSR